MLNTSSTVNSRPNKRVLTLSAIVLAAITVTCEAQTGIQTPPANTQSTATRQYFLFGDPQLDTGFYERLRFSSDRPQLTESIRVLPTGVIQAELGYLWSRADRSFKYRGSRYDVQLTDQQVPLAFRLGVLDWLEVRLDMGWSTFEEKVFHFGTTVFNDKTKHMENVDVGIKAALLKQDAWLPEVSGLFEISMPTGDGASNYDITPLIGGIFNWTLDDTFSLRTSLQYMQFSRLHGKNDSGLFESIVLEGLVSPELQVFTEFAALQVESSKGVQTLGFGARYAVNDSIQLDVTGGFGLNNNSPDQFIGTGIVFQR